MSDPIVKGVKRSSTRPSLSHTSTTSSAKNRSLGNKSAARPKPIAKRSAAEKAPARKATKTSVATSAKSKTARKPAKSAPVGKAAPKKSIKAVKAKAASNKTAPAKQQKNKVAASSAPKPRAVALPKKTAKPPAPTKHTPARKSSARQQTVRSAPTQDEAAALKAFERAHKEFARGRFVEARNQFRQLVEKHPGASEVTARARTYLAIAEARLRTESTLPRDADSLYDRGVIELNRGEYVAAQEMFERALKREPEAAHIHYGLAATRARLGSIDLALQSLQKALDLQPSLRVRAQHDQDLTPLRNDPDFEQLVFTPRF